MMYPSKGEHALFGMNSSFEEADIVVLPIPYESTGSYKVGTRFGPKAIIAASNELETFDLELNKNLCDLKICTLPEMEVDVSSPEAMVDEIEEVVSQILGREKFFILLGGEHTITVGAVKPLAKKAKNLTVLSLDAHADMRDVFQNSKYSHACVMRRCLEHAKLVLGGVRSMSEEEFEFIHENKVPVYDVSEAKKIIKSCEKNVYLSLDLDVFDPSVIPGVGCPVPLGVNIQPVLQLLRDLFKERNVIGVDVVELIPDGLSEDIAAFIAAKILAYKSF